MSKEDFYEDLVYVVLFSSMFIFLLIMQGIVHNTEVATNNQLEILRSVFGRWKKELKIKLCQVIFI